MSDNPIKRVGKYLGGADPTIEYLARKRLADQQKQQAQEAAVKRRKDALARAAAAGGRPGRR
jgi:hypothetical protein